VRIACEEALPIMQTFDESGQDAGRRDIWEIAALCLPAVAVLMIGASVAQVWNSTGMSMRDRLFFVAENTGVFHALLALTAVAIVAAREFAGRRSSGISAAALNAASVVAALTVIGGVYLVWNAFTIHVHIPGPNSTDSFGLGILSDSWSDRLSLALPGLAAIALGLTAAVAARRQRSAGRSSGSPLPEAVTG